MANKNMTYKIAMWLDSSQMGRGAAKAKSALQGLRSTMLSVSGALVGVAGISAAFKKMTETAKEMSSARIVLQNVSKSTLEFANNQQFVNKLAKDYKQDVIGLTSGFAQFKAASDAANVSLSDSRKIYESLTRAAAYYNLSSEQTSNMLNAVVQMMSKGKIAAEELRRQLGNAIPGAVAIMQKSLGVTSAEFEKMLKDGKLMSAEVLPKFADELNNITKDLKITSLQSSLNELKNTFTELVNNVNIEGFSKKVVNAFNSILAKVNQLISKLREIDDTNDFFTELTQQNIAVKLRNGEKLTRSERRFIKKNPLSKNAYQETLMKGDDGNYREYYRRSDEYGVWGEWIEKIGKAVTSGTTSNTGGDNNPKKSELQKEIDKYTKGQTELENQYKNGAINEAKYTEEMAKLNDKTWLAISAISNLNEEIGKIKNGADIVNGIKSGYQSNRDAEAASARAEAQRQANENVDEIMNAFSSALGKTLGTRDASNDFKKSKVEILGENADYWNNQVGALQEMLNLYDELLQKYPKQQNLIDALFADVNMQLDEAIIKAEDFDQALQLQEAQDYIKELNDDYKKASLQGFTSAAESLDRLTKGFQSLSETLANENASGWEKILAIINEVIQAFETLNGVIQAFNTIQELSNKLKEASSAKILADAGAKLVDAEATATLASAEGKEAAAGAASSVAKIPVVGAILAVGAIGAVVASLLGAFSKFETGGIVGGSSYSGDKKFVKVNSGEMILNRGQQANLYDMINGGKSSGNVQFKISGKDLVGVLSNYTQQKKG